MIFPLFIYYFLYTYFPLLLILLVGLNTESNNYDSYCGGLSINRPIKVRIVGSVVHPRMHIRLRRPSQVTRQLLKGVVVNITKVEFCIRPKTPYSSTVCVRGRSGRGFVVTGPQNYVTTEDRITNQG